MSDNANSKTILGQAWVFKDSLLQDQIEVTTNGMFEKTVTLIENIWDDLTDESPSDNYHYKTNGKGYFYWEVKMTSLEDDDIEVSVFIECPRPKPGLFPEPYDPSDYDENSKPYSNYWVTKLQIAQKNYENEYAIQRKEVTFKGFGEGEYQDQTGSTEFTEDGETKDYSEIYGDYTFTNSDIGDITNLLSLF